jgi:hypothetical protein
MTNTEIQQAKQELYKIQKEVEIKKKYEQIKKLASRVGAYIHPRHTQAQEEFVTEMAYKIHVVLQTEMMLNACVSAKQSCFWAAIAAILAGISIILTTILAFVRVLLLVFLS